ncbi:2-oxoadipate dioxygenase/decarboxylase family protein [Escherichia coli]
MVNADELARLNVERHGAIRVGTAHELATLRRMFAIMGMYPVSYYDLSQAGVPVHSTAFRPIDDALWRVIPSAFLPPYSALSLSRTKFLRQKAAEILRQRDIFTPRCRQLLEEYEQQGGFNETQAQEFVQEAHGNVSLAPVSNGR